MSNSGCNYICTVLSILCGCCYIDLKELFEACPLLWILVAPKLRPMGHQIKRHMALYRPIREPQAVTSLWRDRNHLFRLTMGLAPSTLQSHITPLILTQLQVYWAQTTAKHVPFIIILVRFFYIKSSQNHTLYLILTHWGPGLGCARYRAKSLTSLLKRLELVGSVNYRSHPSKPYSRLLWLRSTSPALQRRAISPILSKHRV